MINSRHILVLECALSGHHPEYLERIASAMIEGGAQVTATVLRSEIDHPCVRHLRENYERQITFVALDDATYKKALSTRGGDVGREIALRRMFGEVFEKIAASHPIDYVFLPYLDYCLYALGALGSPFGHIPWGGICMRPSFHYGQYGVVAPRPKFRRIKKLLFHRLLGMKPLRTILTIDELLHRYALDHRGGKSNINYLPDPAKIHGTYSKSVARRSLGIPSDARTVLCYGALDKRKGLDCLINAALREPSVHLLIAGKQSNWARALLASNGARPLLEEKRIHCLDFFVSHDQQELLFAACDAVWLGYRGHYTMSGVLVLAASSGKPVISSQEGLLGWYTQKYSLGAIVDIENNDSVDSAMASVMPDQRSATLIDEISRKFDAHCWENFQSTIRNISRAV